MCLVTSLRALITANGFGAHSHSNSQSMQGHTYSTASTINHRSLIDSFAASLTVPSCWLPSPYLAWWKGSLPRFLHFKVTEKSKHLAADVCAQSGQWGISATAYKLRVKMMDLLRSRFYAATTPHICPNSLGFLFVKNGEPFVFSLSDKPVNHKYLMAIV
jgi:hypothetical protein